MTPMTNAKDKLIVALDLPSYDAARALVNHLGDTVSFYKIGLELMVRCKCRKVAEVPIVFRDREVLHCFRTADGYRRLGKASSL